MEKSSNLGTYLARLSGDDALQQAVARTVLCISTAAIGISDLLAQGAIGGDLAGIRGENADGDAQKALDVVANRRLIEALRSAPVAQVGSEEIEHPLTLQADAPLCVAIDPLDGSSNIETNIAVGTIFSILPSTTSADVDAGIALLQRGTAQLAAGYILYGPHTALVLTLGSGTHIFTYDRQANDFILTESDVKITKTTREFAINVSNFRHWDRHIRAYVDDCFEGEDGVRDSNYNMRWLASLVAECHRILVRGGIFLYPSDAREGYANGRLRLLYEANPIAFLIEQAGGSATTGGERILGLKPKSIHQRVPLIFGSQREVRRVERYYSETGTSGLRSQLFGKRGLFRT